MEKIGLQAVFDDKDFQKGVTRYQDGIDKSEKKTSVLQKVVGGTGLAFTEFSSILNVVERAFSAVSGVIEATIGAYLNLIDNVRESSATWGTSYEDTSRLMEVFGDLGIEAATLDTAMNMLVKNGLKPSIENLAALADEALAIQDPTERATFLAEKFGRGWAEVWPVLSQGGKYLKEQADGVSDVKVITEESVQQSLEYKAAMDSLNDVVEELTYNVANHAVPILTYLAENISTLITLGDRWVAEFVKGQQALIETSGSYEEYIAQHKENKAALDNVLKISDKLLERYPELAAVYDELTEAEYNATRQEQYWVDNAELAMDARDYMIRQSGDLAQVLETEAQRELESAEAARQLADAQRQFLLDAGLGGEIQEALNKYTEALDGQTASQKEAEAQLKKTTLEILYQKTAAELAPEALLEYARAMGQISEIDYETAKATQELTDLWDLNGNQMIDTGTEANGFTGAMLLLNEALLDGKLEASELQAILAGMDGQTYHADFTYTYSGSGTPPPGSFREDGSFETEAAAGYQGWVNGPTRFLTGEGGEPEYVSITPISQMTSPLVPIPGGGGGNINVYFEGMTISNGMDQAAAAAFIKSTIRDAMRYG